MIYDTGGVWGDFQHSSRHPKISKNKLGAPPLMANPNEHVLHRDALKKVAGTKQ